MRRLHLRVLVLTLAGLALLCTVAALAFARSQAHPIGSGVVVIDTNLAYQSAAAAGTGMVLSSSGLVLTNNHVIAGATTLRVVVPQTGHSYRARVLGYSKTGDIALLQLQNASNLKTVSTGDASRLTVGSRVTATGNAGGTGRITSVRGTVTGLGRSITASNGNGTDAERLTGLIETDAPVQPGDSGGPLLDSSGRVVGMNTAASTGESPFASSTGSDAYAITIGRALSVARQIAAGKASATVHVGDTAFLGIEVQAGYGSGALIAGVVSNGPAASAGLEAGDVIIGIDGQTISAPTAVSKLLLAKKPGTTITVTYLDQTGTRSAVSVKLGSGPPQ